MQFLRRKIDVVKDADYCLECHCRINYACETPWKREMSYEAYRAEWFSYSSQTAEYLDALQKSMEDARTLAEILETQDGKTIGYFWMTVQSSAESGFSFAEIQEIYVEKACRGQGIARQMYALAEQHAKSCGAKVLRAGTGCENDASMHLHDALGFSAYRKEYEKVL